MSNLSKKNLLIGASPVSSCLLRIKDGFTLLELIIVFLIIGILSSFSLPVLIAQVGKAREAEAKQGLSAIGFSQQAYYFEHRAFAPNYSDMGLTVSQEFYTFSAPNTAATSTTSDATPKNLGNDPYRTYSLGVYYDIGVFSVILCQSVDPTQFTSAPTSSTGTCSNGGSNIQ